MATHYELYDAWENKLMRSTELAAITTFINETRPNGFEVWEGVVDEDDEFQASRRVQFMHERPDDPRVAEHIGYHDHEDTPSLGDPWWSQR